jgi:hypothetical protein
METPTPRSITPEPFTSLRTQLHALGDRDDLDAYDARERIEYAIKNRSPASLRTDAVALESVPVELRADETALRRNWTAEHIAYSWDNLDPDAQIEPKPDRLSLTWLEIAGYLPLARNGWPLDEPVVHDFFERKRWYHVAEDGKRRLSMIDRVQMEQVQKVVHSLGPVTLNAHLDALPLPGMSEQEAERERMLAEEILTAQAQHKP